MTLLLAIIAAPVALAFLVAWLGGSRLCAYVALIPSLVGSFFYIGNLPSFPKWVATFAPPGSLLSISVACGSVLGLGIGLAFLPRMMWACKHIGDRVVAHDEALYARKAAERAARKAKRDALRARGRVEPSLPAVNPVMTIDH